MISDHLTEFIGLPVVGFDPEAGADDYAGKVYRVGYDWDGKEVPVHEQLEKYFENPKCAEALGLIIGCYDEVTDEPAPVYKALLDNKEKLPNLKGLFLGEATQEESEISWIEHEAITEFFNAFPGLEDLRVRGINVRMEPVRHISLRTLVFESGALSRKILSSVHQSVLPELEHLEFYLGTSAYEGDCRPEDVRPFLYENPFPKVKYLGIRNCEDADEVAQLAAGAPVLDQLETLDLSLGNLSDEGAQALLESEGVRKLKRLNLHHHFVSDHLAEALGALPPEVDLRNRQEPYRYGDDAPETFIAVTE